MGKRFSTNALRGCRVKQIDNLLGVPGDEESDDSGEHSRQAPADVAGEHDPSSAPHDGDNANDAEEGAKPSQEIGGDGGDPFEGLRLAGEGSESKHQQCWHRLPKNLLPFVCE